MKRRRRRKKGRGNRARHHRSGSHRPHLLHSVIRVMRAIIQGYQTGWLNRNIIKIISKSLRVIRVIKDIKDIRATTIGGLSHLSVRLLIRQPQALTNIMVIRVIRAIRTAIRTREIRGISVIPSHICQLQPHREHIDRHDSLRKIRSSTTVITLGCITSLSITSQP